MQTVNANGASIPVLGLGTWTLRDGACVEMVSKALKLGYRHVDTAAAYGNEEAVGEGLRTSGVPRDDIFLTTKVWWTDIAPGDLERSAEASLARLGVDRIDLLLIHWPNPAIELSGSIRALNRMREQGLTRHIGVSNFPTALLAEAIDVSEAPLVANQVEYHPYLDQTKVHAACRAAGMAMVSYCPLSRGGGLFSEPAVTSAAATHGKTPAQIVLRWHIQQEGVVAIPRTGNPDRLAENADLFDFALSEAEMTAISALRSAGRRICDYEFSPRWDAA
ncbi:aldo/keto reductase [Nitratireductor sp. ZSWI3]|uniref:aldo/keto reductase n=1 Tax=Nitratireductor sp. ZSWI3 TaxID=2966359 RepID=UPI00214F6586|nr:aldo/keto reductase [Nitratireductor sp. ZSWI3]MCR4268805.1 aldo/keto reductase [Nitratireductor sp. ZSWI3]